MQIVTKITVRHFLLALGVALSLVHGPAWAQSMGNIIDMADASPPVAGINWSYASNTYTVTGDVTIKGTTGTGAASNGLSVVVDAASPAMTITITLDNATIDVSATNFACAFDMTGATVTLVLAAGSSNTLKSGTYRAGVRAPGGTTLTIRSDPANPGSLTATSGGGDTGGSAGIGGNNFESGGTIKIESGTITATGGDGGAGIGGGAGLGTDGGNITISGGTVTATSLHEGAGIGGGIDGEGGTITITGNADVTATGGDSHPLCLSCAGGAGIGSGGSTYPPPATARAAGAIKIDTSGAVNATGGLGKAPGGNGANIGQGGYKGGDGAGLDSFSTHPADASATVGDNVTFTCAASAMTGTGSATLDWDWRLGGASLAPPVDTASLTLTNVTAAMDGNKYNCVLTVTNLANDANSTITYTSHPARLTVKSVTAPATAVPTLGEWALVLLTLTLAMLAVRRRQA